MNRFRSIRFFIFLISYSIISVIYSSCSPRVSQVKPEEKMVLQVRDINLVDHPDKTEVIIAGSGPIPYTTFRLTDPPRLIVDLARTSLGRFKEKIDARGGAVTDITPKEGERPNMVSRLEMVLTGLAESNVRRDGNNLIIEISKMAGKVEIAREERGLSEGEAAKTEIKGQEPPVIEEKVLPPARNVSKIDIEKSEKGIRVTVTGDGEMRPSTFIVGEKRLVFDIPNTVSRIKQTSIQVNHPILKRIRVGQHKDPEKVRIVLDLNKLIPYIIDKKGDQFIVFLGESIPTKVTIEEKPEAPPVEVKPAEAIPVAKPALSPAEGEEKPEIKKEEVPAEIPKVVPPPLVEKPELKVAETLPATREEKPEAMKETAPEASKPKEELPSKEITPSPPAKEEKVEEKPKEVAPPSPAKEEKVEEKPEEKIEKKEKKEIVSLPEATPPQPPMMEETAKKYKGRKVSLDFQDAEITSILRLLADISGKNLVMGEDVKGRISIKLSNVPWDQALDIVLKMNSLGKVEEENVIRIGTLGNIARQQEEEAKAKESMIRAEDLATRVINVNYAKAQDLSEAIKKNLSPRGDFTIDARTNAIIIKDIEKNIDKINALVKILDTPTPQVMIEAKVVQAIPEFTKDLGVQWGADFKNISGNNSIGISAGPGTGPTFGTPTTGFGVNLPSGGTNPATLGFTFGRLTNSPINLDLRLSAAESRGMTKTISSPKIATLDNQEAKIEQGESIPFATTSLQGTQTTFVDANLTLSVTPHITTDGSIIMKVKVSKNAPGKLTVSAGPSIEKREATTNVLVKDGDTVVIGGIYESTTRESSDRIPFLSNIPLLGWLFKREHNEGKTTELLVFLTPRIIK